jgi:hypothetical protein
LMKRMPGIRQNIARLMALSMCLYYLASARGASRTWNAKALYSEKRTRRATMCSMGAFVCYTNIIRPSTFGDIRSSIIQSRSKPSRSSREA